VLVQLIRRKWNWLGHTLRKSGDSIVKQALQWTAQGHRGRGRPRMKCGRRVSGTAGGRWRRRRRTELDGYELSVAYAPPGVTRHKSSKSRVCEPEVGK